MGRFGAVAFKSVRKAITKVACLQIRAKHITIGDALAFSRFIAAKIVKRRPC